MAAVYPAAAVVAVYVLRDVGPVSTDTLPHMSCKHSQQHMPYGVVILCVCVCVCVCAPVGTCENMRGKLLTSLRRRSAAVLAAIATSASIESGSYRACPAVERRDRRGSSRSAMMTELTAVALNTRR